MKRWKIQPDALARAVAEVNAMSEQDVLARDVQPGVVPFKRSSLNMGWLVGHDDGEKVWLLSAVPGVEFPDDLLSSAKDILNEALCTVKINPSPTFNWHDNFGDVIRYIVAPPGHSCYGGRRRCTPIPYRTPGPH